MVAMAYVSKYLRKKLGYYVTAKQVSWVNIQQMFKNFKSNFNEC